MGEPIKYCEKCEKPTDYCKCGPPEVFHKISATEYSQVMNYLERARNPYVTFVEDIDAMRVTAQKDSKKALDGAYGIMSRLTKC